MKFKELFGNKKTIFGMIHLNACDTESMLDVAKREIEIYLANGIYPLIENYFGSADDCELVLDWMYTNHPDAIYGVNILGDPQRAFELAANYGGKFIQIDSVCGHLAPDMDEEYAEWLNMLRYKAEVVLLGGVRFKYQPVNSGRSLKEDLLLGKDRCDAIVCTGAGTGHATPFEKVNEFKSILGDFPVIVGAGVTDKTAAETAKYSDGAIVGSWFKHNHQDIGFVDAENVKMFINKFYNGQDFQ